MVYDIGLQGQKFILVFFRVLSILWLLPLFSSRSISVSYKAGLGLLISFLVLEYASLSGAPLENPYLLLLLVIREVFIGITIGFFIRVLFTTVFVAGEVAALQAGLGFARFMDPYTNTQVSEISQILNLLALMVFFAVDAHHMVIRGLILSFKEIPLGNAGLKGPLFEYLIQMTGKVFSLGLQIGAPIIITLFLVELGLGMLSRMVPQINVFVEGMPLKIMVTIAMLSFSLSLLVPLIGGFFKSMDSEIPKIIRLMV
jgi:flagellar biosynthesis protein FliR